MGPESLRAQALESVGLGIKHHACLLSVVRTQGTKKNFFFSILPLGKSGLLELIPVLWEKLTKKVLRSLL